MEEKELKEIASQLSCPKGENGLEIASLMHQSNISMTRSGISAMELTHNDRVLELGHGSCRHLHELLESADKLSYCGLEISELMHQEAKHSFDSEQTQFALYDGIHIPFPENHFDKAFTVNTIYFWEEPIKLMGELHRVLKKGGELCIVYAHKTFMEKLPFCQYGFEFYEEEKLASLVNTSGLKMMNSQTYIEEIESKTGEKVQRKYIVARLQK